MTRKEMIKMHAEQQETRMREVLEELSSATIELDLPYLDGSIPSFYMNYNEHDMLNAASILYHVCGNYAIKHGYLTQENTTEKINKFREMLKETFGLDTIEETEKMCILNELDRIGGWS